MDQESLQVALVPPGTLLRPVDEVAVRLFEGYGIEHFTAVAGAAQPCPKISVLGHVAGVPCSEVEQHVGAEMVGRASKRDRRAELREPGEHLAEPHAVLNLEPASYQVLPAVEEPEAGLQARDRCRLHG